MTENPKTRHGAAKTPVGLIPGTAEIAVAEVFRLGAEKYGAYNWREAGVEAMTYVHAARRHLISWTDGEDVDPESGQSHLAHVAACMMILIDAGAVSMLHDNRPPPSGSGALIRVLGRTVAAPDA